MANDVRSITAGGTLSAPFSVPTMDAMPSSIVTGPDGNLWFAETATNKIAMMTPGGVVTEFTLPTPNSGPADLVVGNDGELWFSEGLTGKIGRIFIKATGTGSHKPGDFDAEWATPTTNSEPAGITVGPDCNIWFTEMNSGYVGRIDESGMITEFTLPTPNSQPLGITLGPDGNLWIAESAANQIAKLTLPTGSPTTCSTLGLPPVAKCQNVTVSTATGTCKSPATVSIDNGSTDPNGQTLTSLLAPPAPYNLGTTPVGLTVSDSFATSACYATVLVKDTENPVITCPAAALAECTSPAGAVVTLTATATDNCPNLGMPTCAGSGASFKLGSTNTQCRVTDGSGNTGTCSTSVFVKDTKPPTITSVTANPNALWPPDHKMVLVTVSVSAADTCDPNPSCKITGIVSNEAVTPPTSQITGNLTANIRAERLGAGTGRIYTISVQCSDASGNTATGTTTVSVSHNQ